MSGSVNIGGDPMDMSYRYKMPRLITKIEGRGNGIKTVLVNIQDVASALHCDAGYPTKFFGLELGAQSTYNEKTDKAIVNGAHSSTDLAVLLDKFIKIFILCPKCHLPELTMAVKKSAIKISCAACGNNQALNTVHKLATYIQKNPPSKSGSAGLNATTADDKDKDKDSKDKKEEKKKKKKEKKDTDDKSASPKEKDDSKVSKLDKTEAQENSDSGEDSPKEKKKVKKTKKDDDDSDADSDDDEEEKEKKVKPNANSVLNSDWSVDTSKEAQRAREEEELNQMKSANETIQKAVAAILKDTKEGKSTEANPSAVLKVFIASGKRTPDDIQGEVKRIMLARGLDDLQARKVVLEAVLDATSANTITDQLKANALVLKRFATDKSTTKMMLTCLEAFIGNSQSNKLIVRAPHILQRLYEDDVLDEESIVSWYESPPESSWNVSKEAAAKIRVKAKPFIDWLQTAKEADD
eukprot:TRINITY_DN2906_c1_g1_i1.p1 TRINITY_DN2906_c1_g1~~TRINITY_DN2906_c1_g1_i1.p1  ORF type:complete len:467 (+),score=174.31 TRINITY_DN2906_c1_g1_i1:215-1615(+)